MVIKCRACGCVFGSQLALELHLEESVRCEMFVEDECGGLES